MAAGADSKCHCVVVSGLVMAKLKGSVALGASLKSEVGGVSEVQKSRSMGGGPSWTGP